MAIISLGVWGTSRPCVLRIGALRDARARGDIELTFRLSKIVNGKPASKFAVPLQIQQPLHVDRGEFDPKAA